MEGQITNGIGEAGSQMSSARYFPPKAGLPPLPIGPSSRSPPWMMMEAAPVSRDFCVDL